MAERRFLVPDVAGSIPAPRADRAALPELAKVLGSSFRIGRVGSARLPPVMGSLIKKRRKRMRKKKHKKMLKRTRFQRRAAGK